MINLKFNLCRIKDVYSNPMIINKFDSNETTCLVDTGARVPVWCSGIRELFSYYPNCHKLNAIFILSGFGKGYEVAEVYSIPNFILSDGKERISYKNLLVAVIDKDFSTDMILGYSLFNKMNISIDTFSNRNGFHNVAPNFKVAAQKDTYNVGYRLVNPNMFNKNYLINNFGTCNVIDSVYMFTQGRY